MYVRMFYPPLLLCEILGHGTNVYVLHHHKRYVPRVMHYLLDINKYTTSDMNNAEHSFVTFKHKYSDTTTTVIRAVRQEDRTSLPHELMLF